MKKLHISFWLLVVISVCALTGVLQLLNELPVSYDVLVGIRCAIYLVLLILTLLMGKVGLDLFKKNKGNSGKKVAVMIANIFMLIGIMSLIYVIAWEIFRFVTGTRAYLASSVSASSITPPVLPYIIYIVVAHMNKTEENMTVDQLTVKKSGGVKITLGWIFSIIGAVGAIISGIAYISAKDDYENRIYSFYSRSKSDMQVAQIALFICLGVLILGVILLVAGYISRSQKQSDMRTEKIMQQLVNNNQNNIAPAVNIPVYTEEKTGVSCPNCGYKNTEGAKFCNSCGQKLETGKICAGCGFENAATAKFCKHCGEKLIKDEVTENTL